jgi:LysR family transcriptional regulator, nitrogen assimilation regulatory protein
MLDNRKLRYFMTVAEFGSFTKAADALHITQPALSRQIKQLEEELGVDLLLREGRGIRLTDAGEAVLLHARTIARDFERLREDMQTRTGTPTGRVVFGIPPTLADTLVPRLVEATRHKLPLVTLKVAEGLTPVLLDWVRSSDADLAIVSLAHADDAAEIAGVALEAVAHEDMVVVEKACTPSPPAVYERTALTEKPIVVSQMLADIVRRQLGALHLPLNVTTEIDSVQAVKTMVLRGQAATILPVSMLATELAAGEVVVSAITSTPVRRTLALAEPSFRHLTQATEAVRRLAKELIVRMAEEGIFSLDAISARLS